MTSLTKFSPTSLERKIWSFGCLAKSITQRKTVIGQLTCCRHCLQVPLQFVLVSNTRFVKEGKNRVAPRQSHETAHKLCTRPMSETEESHQLIIDEGFPCMPSSPRKTRCLDSANRQPFAQPHLDLPPQPFQVLQLLAKLVLRIAADNDAGYIGDVLTDGMNETVSFDQYLDIQFQHPLERLNPAPAIDVGIGRRKIHAHKRIRND